MVRYKPLVDEFSLHGFKICTSIIMFKTMATKERHSVSAGSDSYLPEMIIVTVYALLTPLATFGLFRPLERHKKTIVSTVKIVIHLLKTILMVVSIALMFSTQGR